MKVKKLHKILPEWEVIRIWGNDERTPLWEGYVQNIPLWFEDKKLTEGEDGGYIDVRYGCNDCDDHVAVFIKE